MGMRPNSVHQTTSVSSSRPRCLRSLNQGGGGLIEDRGVVVVLLLEFVVTVPVEFAAAGIGAVEELHEADAAFDQPPGENAVSGESGFDRVGFVRRSVQFQDVRRLGRSGRLLPAR